MHFVKKEPTTEEERLAKEKERAIKLGKYLTARNRIFEKNRAEEFDEELLLLTQAVLSKNPDISTFWNLRRKTINLMIANLMDKDDSINGINRLLNSEMGLTHECLMQANPKSYGAWHHRGWTLERFRSTGLEADFKSELAMCKKALDFDCRNFHCWDHRRIVSKLAKCTDEEELNFSLDRINHNFSNYSAWHYRSVLLPRVQQTKTGSPRLDEALLNEELEKIANAFSCDPDDQSAFVYARWLLALDSCKTFMHSSLSDPSLPLSITFTGKNTIIVMSKAAKMEEILQFVQISDRNLLIPLSTASSKPRSAVVWKLESQQKCLSRLQKEDELVYSDSLVNMKRMRIVYDCDLDRTETLVAKTLMAKLEELMSIPPISAWTKYTYALCLMELNPAKHHSQIVEILEELADSMDCKRRELYKATISRLTICHTLREETGGKSFLDRILSGEESCLNLQRKKITSLSSIEFLAGFLETLILGENELRNLDDILLPNLENLTVSENPISRIPPLPCLSQLKSLNIAGTPVNGLDSIVPGLKTLTNLEKLIICETAVVKNAPQLYELLGNNNIRIINYWL